MPSRRAVRSIRPLLFGGLGWVLISVLAVAASAQTPAKKRCLSDAEVKTEQMVRHGVFLREAATRCDGLVPGSAKLWRDFDKTAGDRLKKQTDAHNKWLQRKFGDDWKQAADFYDGRLVTAQRNYPLSQTFCDSVKTLLDANAARGWATFARQAKSLQDEVVLDFKLCNPKR
jgi:hypothetical protein